MAPTKIMLIRHGEKHHDFPDDKDIDENGRPDKASLNHRGWRRAAALAPFFNRPHVAGVAQPDWIFAAAPGDDSRRPMQTVTLLAEAMWPDRAVRAFRFNASIDGDDIAKL